MKKLLIFFSITIVALLAFFDAKDRIAELNKVAANTPSQVEMRQMINETESSMPKNKNNFDYKRNNNGNVDNLHKKMIDDNKDAQDKYKDNKKQQGK